jgi:hypothetical protein
MMHQKEVLIAHSRTDLNARPPLISEYLCAPAKTSAALPRHVCRRRCRRSQARCPTAGHDSASGRRWSRRDDCICDRGNRPGHRGRRMHAFRRRRFSAGRVVTRLANAGQLLVLGCQKHRVFGSPRERCTSRPGDPSPADLGGISEPGPRAARMWEARAAPPDLRGKIRIVPWPLPVRKPPWPAARTDPLPVPGPRS